jgi:hypothetical protein
MTFSTSINAPKDLVWRTMLEDETYRQWTSAFHEGSYAVTDWKPGSKALFLAPDGSGMVSRVADHRPNEHLSLEHLGIVRNGVEDTTSTDVLVWAGARRDTLRGRWRVVSLSRWTPPRSRGRLLRQRRPRGPEGAVRPCRWRPTRLPPATSSAWNNLVSA